MEIEIAEHGRMTESGSSLLRLIQNNNIPLLDLLVRESVQNSLDAAKEKAKAVNVEFVTGKFDAAALNAHFDRITQKLDKKYPSAYGEDYDFIQIKDSGTNGLTGPVSYDDVENNQFGNLLKLVYEICKPQQNEGAGGSWGLGKTVYFRMGTGLVIYYSRIKQDEQYVERMAACMVEDETKPSAILPSKGKLKRGIAWWGKAIDKNHTVPLEDSPEIKEILDIFCVKPYSGTETGTTIIIPYIDPDRLLSDVYALNEEDTDRPYWTRQISDYINVAIQRWYAPRIRNSSYTYGPYLAPSVNGHKILPDNMLPLFKAIREMYNITEENKGDNDFTEEGYTVICEQISLRNVFGNGSIAGRLVCVKLDKTYLKMLPPDNCKSPYQHVSNTVVTMDAGNSPLIMYTRRPGMIVGYDYSGAWTHSMTKCSPDEFIIGLFTLNSSNQLRSDSTTDKTTSLEEYIRQGEKADHAAWTDHNVKGNNPRIVYNIQKNVIKKINQTYKEKIIDTSERKNIGLSHALADMLLPSRDFGKKPSAPSGGGSGGSGGSSASRKSSFTLVGTPVYKNGVLSYTYEMVVRNNTCTLEAEVITDFAKYNADKWEEEIGMPFPLEFDNFTIDTIRDKTGNESQHTVSLTGSQSDADCSVEAVRSQTNSILNAVNINCTDSAKEELLIKLSEYNLSNDGKNPMEYDILKAFSVAALRRIFAAIIRSKNYVDISRVNGKDLPKHIDIMTYSFPCQDLSNVGAFHGYNLGIDKDSGSRSSLLWEVGRIISEMRNSRIKPPRFLLMENVPSLLSERHRGNFKMWREELSELGYESYYYQLNASSFGLPQNRPRLLMISAYVGKNQALRNKVKRFLKKHPEDVVWDYQHSPYYRD